MGLNQDRYSLIILDDEYPVLRGLETLVDWDKFHVNVTATARNGVHGLELIQNHRPDLVLTDIRMPGMNGLEFVKKASAVVPNSVFIVFSGYSEFTYAKKALSLGVIEYLEKPVTVEKIESVIPRALQKIEYRHEHETLRSIRSKARKGIIDNAILYMIAEKELDVPGLEEALKEIDGHLLRYPCIAACMISFDCADEVVEAVHKRVLESITEPSEPGHLVLPLVHQGACLVLAFSSREDVCDMLIKRLCELDDPEGTYRVYAGLSTVGSKLGDLMALLQEAEKALAIASSGNISSIVRIQDVTSQQRIPFSLEVRKDEMLLQFRLQKRRLFLQSLKRHFYQLRSLEVPGSVIFREFQELYYLCTKVVQEMGNSGLAMELDEIAFPDNFLKFAFSTVFLREVTASFERLFDTAYLKTDAYTHKAILRLKEYIDRNHHHKDISLQKMSELSHLSTAYVSKLFKKEIGMNYHDYLTKVRLEHSKILLAQGYKVKEVGNRIGYGNYRTFCLLFRKTYGMNPSVFTGAAKSKSL